MPAKPVPFALLAGLLFAACRREQSAPPPPPPPAVTAITLEARDVTLTRELPGRTTPFLVAEVRPQVTGIVQKRLFEEGSRVEAGQPLYQLDDSTYRADHNRAKAALARARAALELARLNAERSADLAQRNAISRQENETAIATLRQAEADIGVAEAAAANTEVVLGYTTLRAPIAGRIGRSSVTQGALVTANQDEPLATIQQLDPIYVDLTQSSREFLELRRDLATDDVQRPEEVEVTLLLEDGTRYQETGKLAFREVSVDPTTGSFAMRIVIGNPRELLLPGMYVRAVVPIAERPNAVLAPQQGIARDPKGNATAMVVGADNKAELRTVEVERTIGNQWLVNKGLQAGDRLIVEGLQKIRPGAPVRITATEIPPAVVPGGPPPNPAPATTQAAPAAKNNSPAQPAATPATKK